jgi:mRNA interferase RelE/StbE
VYEVLIEHGAERDLRRLPTEIAGRVVTALKALGENPYPVGSRKITGSRSDWRIRVGDYRAIYEVEQNNRTVRIMRIRHRREVYR